MRRGLPSLMAESNGRMILLGSKADGTCALLTKQHVPSDIGVVSYGQWTAWPIRTNMCCSVAIICGIMGGDSNAGWRTRVFQQIWRLLRSANDGSLLYVRNETKLSINQVRKWNLQSIIHVAVGCSLLATSSWSRKHRVRVDSTHITCASSFQTRSQYSFKVRIVCPASESSVRGLNLHFEKRSGRRKMRSTTRKLQSIRYLTLINSNSFCGNNTNRNSCKDRNILF